MGYRQSLQGTGGVAIAFAFMAGLFLVVWLFIAGSVAVSAALLPELMWAFWIVLVIDIVVLVPLSFIQRTERFAGTALLYSSYLFGLTLWAWSLLLTYHWWGWFGVVIGLLIVGVGVVPVAMLAALVHGAWAVLGETIFILVVAYGTRALGTYVAMRARERAFAQATKEAGGRVIDVDPDDWHRGDD